MNSEPVIAEIRESIAALVTKHPDSSHGQDYVNRGLEAALRVIDKATGAPCWTDGYNRYCRLHMAPTQPGHDRCEAAERQGERVPR